MAQDNGPERGGDDLLAAEYVLGVLAADERADASAPHRRAKPAFARLVDRLGGAFFADGRRLCRRSSRRPRSRPRSTAGCLPPAQPPHTAQAAAPASGRASPSGAALPPRRSRRWRSTSPCRCINPPVEQPQTRLVASLAADGSDVKYLVVYDAAKHDVGLSHVSGERAAGQDFELWMIEGKNAPVSMGVIPVGATTHLT